MSEYTTIRITKQLKDKLDVLKSVNGDSYNDIIEKILEEQKIGTTVDDVITLDADSVAISLKYLDDENSVYKDITFKELKNSKVGDVFYANKSPNNQKDFINSVAEVMAIKGDDMALLVKQMSVTNGNLDVLTNLVHVKLF